MTNYRKKIFQAGHELIEGDVYEACTFYNVKPNRDTKKYYEAGLRLEGGVTFVDCTFRCKVEINFGNGRYIKVAEDTYNMVTDKNPKHPRFENCTFSQEVYVCVPISNIDKLGCKSVQQSVTRLYISDAEKIERLPQQLFGCERLENLTIHNVYKLKEIPKDIGKLKSLRVLLITAAWEITELPKEIGELSNLRELSLPYFRVIRKLPDSICALNKLEILDVREAYHLESIPEEIFEIASLKRVATDFCTKLKGLPEKFATNLPEEQTTDA